MNEIYEKPEIRFESFEISEFIAGTCTVDVGFGDVGATNICSLYKPEWGETLFNDYSICTADIKPGDDDFDGICYHGPNPNSSYFGS